jgi:hypothetical protein
MPDVPSNTALIPSLSICDRIRTPIGVSRRSRSPRIERLDLRQLGREVLLISGHAEGADDLAAELGQCRAKILVVAFAVIGRIVDDGDGLVANLRDQFSVGVSSD